MPGIGGMGRGDDYGLGLEPRTQSKYAVLNGVQLLIVLYISLVTLMGAHQTRN